jgi:hypothetical protein
MSQDRFEKPDSNDLMMAAKPDLAEAFGTEPSIDQAIAYMTMRANDRLANAQDGVSHGLVVLNGNDDAREGAAEIIGRAIRNFAESVESISEAIEAGGIA